MGFQKCTEAANRRDGSVSFHPYCKPCAKAVWDLDKVLLDLGLRELGGDVLPVKKGEKNDVANSGAGFIYT